MLNCRSDRRIAPTVRAFRSAPAVSPAFSRSPRSRARTLSSISGFSLATIASLQASVSAALSWYPVMPKE